MLQLMGAAQLVCVPCENCSLKYMPQEPVQAIDWVVLGIDLRLNKVQKLPAFQWPQGQFP